MVSRRIECFARQPLISIAVLVALAVVGCTEKSDSNPDASQFSDASVDAPIADLGVLERIVELIRDADYITFDYAQNGCHDRSILLSAVLANAGIPTHAQFAIPTESVGDGQTGLTPRQFPGLQWNYHVVPVVYLEDLPPPDARLLHVEQGELATPAPSGAYVVDPALYPDAIVAPLETWIADLTGEQQNAFVSVADARDALNVLFDPEAAGAQGANATLAQRIDAMPRLWQFQLSSSCGFLARDAAMADGVDVDAIRDALNTEVALLTEELQHKKRLLDVEPISARPCWDTE